MEAVNVADHDKKHSTQKLGLKSGKHGAWDLIPFGGICQFSVKAAE